MMADVIMNYELDTYYRVASDVWCVPVREHLEHGFETKHAFRKAAQNLIDRWHDREGKAVGQKNNFLLLHFCDSVGGLHEEAWLPDYLLTQIPKPEYLNVPERDETEEEIDKAFGFD